jgi:cyclic pyranopterin phosphate synthase
MPAEGVSLLQHSDILSFEEIAEVSRVAIQLGVEKIRLTGGEPLVRKGIIDLVKMLSVLPGLNDLSMTTNGILLGRYAQPLKDAGLHRINVSLDTMDAERYREIARGGNLKDVLLGIDAAQKAGLYPIKLNCVVKSSSKEPDAQEVLTYGLEHGLEVRFIHEMSLTEGHFTVVEGGEGGNCAHCNRLRLTANGKLMPCLFNDLEFDVRTLGAAAAIRLAVAQKPECGSFNLKGEFYNIGG